MKVALLSDIHGNGGALDAVLARADALGVERIVAAGDLVGYYYDAAHVVRRLRERDAVVVRGNHEDMLMQWMAGDPGVRERLYRRYGSGFKVAADELPADDVAWLRQLPHPFRTAAGGKRLLVCHGSPDVLDDYVYPDADAAQRSKVFPPDVDMTVFGHTHYPVVWHDSGRLAVNPGSVGQQRHGVPGASWALWDTARGEATLMVEDYDRAALAKRCAETDPHLPMLASVLYRGRDS